ncbi:MAG: hypothetical protein IKO43_01755, partial [Kiritimatiellae bacterium]|nr:hypothetical protein [Kiritimatiellia bacterium]
FFFTASPFFALPASSLSRGHRKLRNRDKRDASRFLEPIPVRVAVDGQFHKLSQLIAYRHAGVFKRLPWWDYTIFGIGNARGVLQLLGKVPARRSAPRNSRPEEFKQSLPVAAIFF